MLDIGNILHSSGFEPMCTPQSEKTGMQHSVRISKKGNVNFKHIK